MPDVLKGEKGGRTDVLTKRGGGRKDVVTAEKKTSQSKFLQTNRKKCLPEEKGPLSPVKREGRRRTGPEKKKCFRVLPTRPGKKEALEIKGGEKRGKRKP